MKSLYKILKIEEKASKSEIKKAYRTLARKYHPDINKDKGAVDKFKEVNNAYEVLSDDKKRKNYDQFGDDIFGGNDFGNYSRQRESQSQDINIDDIFSQFFSQSQGRNPFKEQRENLDQNVLIDIDFETSILGGKKTISVNNQTITFKIPEGIESGKKLRIREKGKRGRDGNIGNLIVELNVLKSIAYSTKNGNLYKIIDISFVTAIFGGKIDIKTLRKDISLKIPENTRNGQKFRVKGDGILNIASRELGDLYLEINITLPNSDKFNKKLKQELEEL